MDSTSWNDHIAYDKKLNRNGLEFWNIQMYFDEKENLGFALSPMEVFCKYNSAQAAYEALRIITCEVTDESGDEYLIEILRIPPFTGTQIAYKLTDVDSDITYAWDSDNAYEISTLIFNVATKTLSNYFKKTKKWAVLASSDKRIISLGDFKIIDFSLWENRDNRVGILFDVSTEYAVNNVVMLITDVYWNGDIYTLYYRWDNNPLIEAKLNDDLVELPKMKDLVIAIKTIILELLANKKVGLLPD